MAVRETGTGDAHPEGRSAAEDGAAVARDSQASAIHAHEQRPACEPRGCYGDGPRGGGDSALDERYRAARRMASEDLLPCPGEAWLALLLLGLAVACAVAAMGLTWR